MEVVINRCFGGFGLSHEAVMRYAELSGFKLYPFHEGRGDDGQLRFGPPYEDGVGGFLTHYSKAPLKDGKYEEDMYFYEGSIPRSDPVLVCVVKEMGRRANGRCAALAIVEIPEGIAWHIEEYDGQEHIAEDHRTWG